MQTIKEPLYFEKEIKKSKFITKVFPVYSLKDTTSYIEKEKQIHKNATHICYAYKIGPITKCFDDGEPSGTAGLPILNILNFHSLQFVLCIVIRYFGGIKLGATGLLRAYAGCANDTIKQCHFTQLIEGIRIFITFPYQHQKQINYLLQKYEIIEKKYQQQIYYTLEVDKITFPSLKASLQPFCTEINIEENVIIKTE